MALPFFNLRAAASGPVIEAANAGDTIVWNATEKQWETGPAAGFTEFDHIISSRADLVAAVGAPVGGEFLLTAGSYFFRQNVQLDAGETVAADAVTVFLMGGGPVGSLDRGFEGNGASSDAAFHIRNGANVRMLNMRIAGVAIAQHGVLVENSEIDFDYCALPTTAGGSQPGLLLGAGSTSRVNNTSAGGGVQGVLIEGGAKHLFRGCILQGGSSGSGVRANVGATVCRIQFDGCFFRGSASGSPPVLLETAADLDAFFHHCEFECNVTGGQCLLVRGIGSLTVIGGFFNGTASAPLPDGISLATDPMQGGVQIIGAHGHSLDDFVVASNLFDCRRAVIAGCDTATDVTVGVDWQAPVPANGGLLLIGNNWDTATPLQGVNAATARVNLKACSDRNGLMTETAIVP